MSRAIKPAATIAAEGRAHRTKAELEARAKAEAAMLSGEKLKERPSVKNDENAHREYKRVSKLLAAIGKDDALYSAVVNRYCELFSETVMLAEITANCRTIISRLSDTVERLEEDNETDPDKLLTVSSALAKALSSINTADSRIMTKRKMMLDIEKECCMTVSAALRTIPKDAAKTEQDDALVKALNGAADDE